MWWINMILELPDLEFCLICINNRKRNWAFSIVILSIQNSILPREKKRNKYALMMVCSKLLTYLIMVIEIFNVKYYII